MTRDEAIEQAVARAGDLIYLGVLDENVLRDFIADVYDANRTPAPDYDKDRPLSSMGRGDLERELLQWRKRG
jgi:hypothetical protein